MKRTQTTPPTLDDLQRQRHELEAAQAAAHDKLDHTDPLDWRASSAASLDLQAIAAALVALDSKIAVARDDLALAQAADREKIIDARRQTALKGARSATRAAIDVTLHLNATVLHEMDVALQELARCGIAPTGATAIVAGMRKDVANALRRLEFVDPTLVGKAPLPSAKETAVNEARESLRRAEAHLGALQAARTWDSNATQKTRRLEDAAAAVTAFQARITELTGERFLVQNAAAMLANFARYTNPIETPEVET